MIVSCPGCQKQYNLAEGSIPAGGRTVRCPACSTAFQVSPTGLATRPSVLAATVPQPVFAPPAPASAPAWPSSAPAAGVSMACSLHAQIAAVAVCCVCGNPVCGECRNKLFGKNYCDACARAQAAPPPYQQQAPPPQIIVQQTVAPMMMPRELKSPFVAGLLSFFFAGLGQIYNGRIGKGIAFFGFTVFLWVVTIGIFGWVGNVIAMVDAASEAGQINRRGY